MYFTFDPGLTVTVNFIFTLREPNVYKPHGFFLGFLATFICFCVTVLFLSLFVFCGKSNKVTKLHSCLDPAEHINQAKHSIKDVLLIPLELIRSNRDSVRKAREAHLIDKARTLEPQV